MLVDGHPLRLNLSKPPLSKNEGLFQNDTVTLSVWFIPPDGQGDTSKTPAMLWLAVYIYATGADPSVHIGHDLFVCVRISGHWVRHSHRNPEVLLATVVRVWDPMSAGADEDTGLVLGPLKGLVFLLHCVCSLCRVRSKVGWGYT